MWKVVTSSNLNSPLKLFFYSPILTNNNLLLKIYCENIIKILWQYFHSFIHMFPFFFLFFFSCFFCTTHVYPYISSSTLLFFFSLAEPPSLFLSPALSFSTLFLFFFYHYLQTHTNTHGEKGEIALTPPHRHCCSSSPLMLHHTHTSLFFFS